jgi:uncharacterized membrane protein YdcZ (DUF606 family)
MNKQLRSILNSIIACIVISLITGTAVIFAGIWLYSDIMGMMP